MASKTAPADDFVPTFTPGDYVRFFSAGALCATMTHGAMTVSFKIGQNIIAYCGSRY